MINQIARVTCMFSSINIYAKIYSTSIPGQSMWSMYISKPIKTVSVINKKFKDNNY